MSDEVNNPTREEVDEWKAEFSKQLQSFRNRYGPVMVDPLQEEMQPMAQLEASGSSSEHLTAKNSARERQQQQPTLDGSIASNEVGGTNNLDQGPLDDKESTSNAAEPIVIFDAPQKPKPPPLPMKKSAREHQEQQNPDGSIADKQGGSDVVETSNQGPVDDQANNVAGADKPDRKRKRRYSPDGSARTSSATPQERYRKNVSGGSATKTPHAGEFGVETGQWLERKLSKIEKSTMTIEQKKKAKANARRANTKARNILMKHRDAQDISDDTDDGNDSFDRTMEDDRRNTKRFQRIPETTQKETSRHGAGEPSARQEVPQVPQDGAKIAADPEKRKITVFSMAESHASKCAESIVHFMNKNEMPYVVVLEYSTGRIDNIAFAAVVMENAKGVVVLNSNFDIARRLAAHLGETEHFAELVVQVPGSTNVRRALAWQRDQPILNPDEFKVEPDLFTLINSYFISFDELTWNMLHLKY